MSQEKEFIGYCKPGKYEDQVDIGLSPEHIKRINELSKQSEKGWVNFRLAKGKTSGKPYMEVVAKSGTATPPPKEQAKPRDTTFDTPSSVPGKISDTIDTEDLPF